MLQVEFMQESFDHLYLLVTIRRGRIHDVHQYVSLVKLVKRRPKGFQEIPGQVSNETHGIGQNHVPAGMKPESSLDGIQGFKRLIFGRNAATSQGVQQGGFPGVGIPHDRHHRRPLAQASGALLLPLTTQVFQLAFEVVNAIPHPSQVGLQFGLAGPPGPDAAAQTGERRAGLRQPGQSIFELREFHLNFPVA